MNRVKPRALMFRSTNYFFSMVATAAARLIGSRPRPTRCALWVVALVAMSAPAMAASDCTLDRAVGTTIDATPFRRNAYGARWNLATDRLAFMAPDAEGYYKVFAMRPDGGDLMPMGAGAPQKHQGSVYWHPSGRYLLFTAEKPEWHSLKLFGNPDYEALPGFGLHDDIWLTSADGRRSWRLTNEPNARQQGILMPVFSPDGRHVAWSDRQVPNKTYAIKVADFVEAPEPHLENIGPMRRAARFITRPGRSPAIAGASPTRATRIPKAFGAVRSIGSIWRTAIASADHRQRL